MSALELLKTYSSDSESCSEEEFRGFPDEPVLPEPPVQITDSNSAGEEWDSDGSFFHSPKKRKLTRHEVRRSEVQKRRRAAHPAILQACNCRKHCSSHISRDERISINKMYWSLRYNDQQSFIREYVRKIEISCRKRNMHIEDFRKHCTYRFQLRLADDTRTDVCREVFLNTLGYGKHCGNIVYRCLAGNDGLPRKSMRGKHRRDSSKHDAVKTHIHSFNPTVSHYRREHAPNRLYLPSDLSEKRMHQDFTANGGNASYGMYCKVMRQENVSLVKLGHEQCELCTAADIHREQTGHSEADPAESNCETCIRYKEHMQLATISRREYRDDGANLTPECIVYSVDLQKVVQIPRLEGLKTLVFAQRLICYNETFAPVGEYSKNQPVIPCLWNEATAGRSSENILSTFHRFLLHFKKIPKIILWLDNCSAQNKNWQLFIHMILYVNSPGVASKEITLKYFESGHTFMSADSFHAAVEKQMKLNPPITFEDFQSNVKQAKSSVEILTMEVEDFFRPTINTTQYLLNKLNPRPYIDKIRKVVFKKGSFNFFYSDSLAAVEQDLIAAELLSKKQRKIISVTNFQLNDSLQHQSLPNGIDHDRKANLVNSVIPLIKAEKRGFWEGLPEKQME